MKNFEPRRPLAKIGYSPRDYRHLVMLGDRVVIKMTGNALFVTPVPTLASVTTLTGEVRDLMKGNKYRRQSAADTVALMEKTNELYLTLVQLLQYVIAELGEPFSLTDFLSSGFRASDIYNRTKKKLQHVRRFKQVNKSSVPFTDRKLKFKKPAGLIKGKKIEGYNIYASDVDGGKGSLLGSSTSTTFYVPETFEGSYLMVIPFNTNGEGNPFITRFYQFVPTP